MALVWGTVARHVVGMGPGMVLQQTADQTMHGRACMLVTTTSHTARRDMRLENRS
jgi:hypothetical protein